MSDERRRSDEAPEGAEAGEQEAEGVEEGPEEHEGEANGSAGANGDAGEKPPEPPRGGELERLRATLKERDRQLEERDKTLREYISSHRKAVQEFDAAKERLRRDIDGQVDRARAKFLTGLLEVLDNLDRSLSAPAPEDSRGRALLDGVKMVREQFLQKLRENGVERLEVVGKRFDPELHEALSTIPAPEPAKDSVIAHEVRAGYNLSGKLLRAAQVVVFKS